MVDGPSWLRSAVVRTYLFTVRCEAEQGESKVTTGTSQGGEGGKNHWTYVGLKDKGY